MIIAEKEKNVYEIILIENLTYKNSPFYVDFIHKHIDSCAEVIIDFKECSLIDSAGVGSIISLHSTYKCNIKLINTNDCIRSIIRITRLDKANFLTISEGIL